MKRNGGRFHGSWPYGAIYQWPFGLHGYTWRRGRLFFLLVDGYGLIWLLVDPRPVLVSIFAVNNREQLQLERRSLGRDFARQARAVAVQAMIVAQRIEGKNWHRLQIPDEMPNFFPPVPWALEPRRRAVHLFLGEQSDSRH